MRPYDRGERLLTASWTPREGVRVTYCVLLEHWEAALPRLGYDLGMRQYGTVIERIDWAAQYDPYVDTVFLLSAVTVAGSHSGGFGGDGMGAAFDADEEKVLVSIADLAQNEVADTELRGRGVTTAVS